MCRRKEEKPQFEQVYEIVEEKYQVPMDNHKISTNEKEDKKEIILEAIKATFIQMKLGSSADDKALKVDLLEEVFGEKTWEGMKKLSLRKLTTGSKLLNQFRRNRKDYLDACAKEKSKPDSKMMYEILGGILDKRL